MSYNCMVVETIFGRHCSFVRNGEFNKCKCTGTEMLVHFTMVFYAMKLVTLILKFEWVRGEQKVLFLSYNIHFSVI